MQETENLNPEFMRVKGKKQHYRRKCRGKQFQQNPAMGMVNFPNQSLRWLFSFLILCALALSASSLTGKICFAVPEIVSEATSGAETEESIFNQGLTQAEKGNFLEAENLFRRVLAINEKNPQALKNLGLVLIGMNRHSDALEALEKIRADYAREPVFWYNLGQCLMKTENYSKASEAFEKSVSLDPDDAESWLELGRSCLRLNDLTRAGESFEKCVVLSPKDPRGHLGCAMASLIAGNTIIFEKELSMLKSLSPEAAAILDNFRLQNYPDSQQ
ncbi:MAG: hypothetical protein CVV64_12895 [Candidatus Wallbacteria bacterium HGW-Wallbacteria-1]|uniref:Uncharacterized protein n=1 Tax=Candidatus Wallbacteria bacterium HGW-Wallbacteria-1 TaxID=2013854 RepID=A0A2N1PMY8_9BACT|nr:MAG: hypothetical protein CVV64_12895 [Candidatus Wallbacteria bacterium HGW-Wallbacteria-1]